MNTLSYKTPSANSATVDKQWVVIDAAGLTVGRMMSRVASIVRGKHKTNFTPHVDCGDNVIILNAEKISFSGLKMDQKEYVSYSGYPGGQKRVTPKVLMDKNPKKILESALKGMLPKNRLGRALFHNVHIYEGAEHPHEAQKPKTITI
ncbi:MAG: 50S ribosomal protein L13 [Cryomorphaceae bacterium]|nr:50S ribosomal protein L13 [Cryomorphaceae bacterium]